MLYSLAALCVTPTLVSMLIWVLSLFPVLVVINKTPFEALLPYKEVEEASFKIEVDAISWGLILLKAPEYGTPSNTISGALLALIDPKPLILIIGSAPGWPLDWITLKPEAKPSKPWIGLE